MNYRVTRKKPFYSSLRVPPDKSISHRVLILSSLAEGTSTVENLLESQDVLTTVKVLKNLGKTVEKEEKIWVIKESGWNEPEDVLNAENSGTTARLIMGILSYLPFFSVITGDNSLRRRPMDRVVMPLTLMGGKFWARKDRYLPVAIKGSRLHA
ncbi:3-phosphoshikimate 1-carboxyvinyltransferase, partial [Candidatus Calescamantes bacterium]|nr:3-phosphoshikimate 1-carboxyvinyltransferase [Candidatus Calescamantes bacterium]